MNLRLLARSCVTVAFVVCASIASAGVLVPIPVVPGSSATFITAINNNNVIAGDYLTSEGVQRGFTGTLDGAYTTFDSPSGTLAAVYGLNDAGYITLNDGQQNEECQFSGCQYLRTPDGNIKPIKKAKELFDGYPEQIISKARFVGDYWGLDEHGSFIVYGYYGKGSSYIADLTLPFRTSRTRPRGYNAAGTVVGYFRDLDHGADNPGFVLKDGVATAVRYPDNSAFYTFFEFLNKRETVAGYWTDENFVSSSAFLYKIKTDAFLPIQMEGATNVYAHGINDAGIATVIVDNVSFIYCPKKKACPLRSPNAIEIAEHWIPTASYSIACKNDCKGPHHPSERKLLPAAVREVIARDPELQRERLPSRP